MGGAAGGGAVPPSHPFRLFRGHAKHVRRGTRTRPRLTVWSTRLVLVPGGRALRQAFASSFCHGCMTRGLWRDPSGGLISSRVGPPSRARRSCRRPRVSTPSSKGEGRRAPPARPQGPSMKAPRTTPWTRAIARVLRADLVVIDDHRAPARGARSCGELPGCSMPRTSNAPSRPAGTCTRPRSTSWSVKVATHWGHPLATTDTFPDRHRAKFHDRAGAELHGL